MSKNKEYNEYMEDIMERRFDLLEGNIKEGISALLDIYAEVRFITYLKLMKGDPVEIK